MDISLKRKAALLTKVEQHKRSKHIQYQYNDHSMALGTPQGGNNHNRQSTPSHPRPRADIHPSLYTHFELHSLIKTHHHNSLN